MWTRTGVAAHLELGFRGVAAGFQPPVATFLVPMAGPVARLTRIDELPKEFQSSVADMRPDYLLVGEIGGDGPPARRIGPARAAAARRSRGRRRSGRYADAAAVRDQPWTSSVMTGATDVALVLARSCDGPGRRRWSAGRPGTTLGFDEACLTFSVGDRCGRSASRLRGRSRPDDGRSRSGLGRRDLHRLVFGRGPATTSGRSTCASAGRGGWCPPRWGATPSAPSAAWAMRWCRDPRPTAMRCRRGTPRLPAPRRPDRSRRPCRPLRPAQRTLNSSPFSTLPKPRSRTLRVRPSSDNTWRAVEIMFPRGPSNRMAKIPASGQGSRQADRDGVFRQRRVVGQPHLRICPGMIQRAEPPSTPASQPWAGSPAMTERSGELEDEVS
jgi:hypothetical protein